MLSGANKSKTKIKDVSFVQHHHQKQSLSASREISRNNDLLCFGWLLRGLNSGDWRGSAVLKRGNGETRLTPRLSATTISLHGFCLFRCCGNLATRDLTICENDHGTRIVASRRSYQEVLFTHGSVLSRLW